MIKQTICGLIAAAALACSGEPKQELKQKSEYDTISGTPISVNGAYQIGGNCVATVVHFEWKNVVAYICGLNSLKAAKLKALIQSEIADGDDDKMELTGLYKSDVEFAMIELKVNGYYVQF